MLLMLCGLQPLKWDPVFELLKIKQRTQDFVALFGQADEVRSHASTFRVGLSPPPPRWPYLAACFPCSRARLPSRISISSCGCSARWVPAAHPQILDTAVVVSKCRWLA
jgi:hypothetical protein